MLVIRGKQLLDIRGLLLDIRGELGCHFRRKEGWISNPIHRLLPPPKSNERCFNFSIIYYPLLAQMSKVQLLTRLISEIKKARSLAYYGRYEDSRKEFSKIISDIESEVPTISDDKLKEEWTKLLDEMKSEHSLIDNMIAMLSCQIIKPKPVTRKDERRIQPRQAEKDFLVSDSEGIQEKKSNKLPFGKEPFRKYHDDDDMHPKEPVERDPLDWGPKPEREKKPFKKMQNKSNVGDNKKREDYEKPWQANAKKNKKEKEEDKDEKKTYLKSIYPDGNGPDAQLINTLERDVVSFNHGISFDDIAELDNAKELLQEAVLLPLRMPRLFRGLTKAWGGVLMFGPPGTGKTHLARAIASTGKTTFFSLSASSFASKWKGDSEKLVRYVFLMARFYAPTTLFIDEIDAIAAGGNDHDGSNRKVLTQILTGMDGANIDPNDDRKVVVIGATNRPWMLDDAIRRRLQKRIYIPLPTAIGRRELLRIKLKDVQLAPDVDLEAIATKTEGFSGSDMENLCKDAAFILMRREVRNAGGLQKIENTRNFEDQVIGLPMAMQDFRKALEKRKASVGNEQLEKHAKWMEEYGEMGNV